MENENTMVTEPAAEAATQTTEPASVGSPGTVTPTASEPSGAVTTETEGGTSASAGEDPSAEAQALPKETPNEESAANAANAERRRRAEEREERRRNDELSRVREEVRRETILETLGSVNPYTHEPMKDDTDIKEYLEMKEIERRGGDPVTEYAKYHKAMERERAADEEKTRGERERRQRIENEREALLRDHPDADLQGLLRDEDFLSYARSRTATKTLSEIYEGYMERRQSEERRVEERARELAAQMVANASASPGSAVGAPQAAPTTFTPEQLKRMSREEIHENYDKIAKSYWK